MHIILILQSNPLAKNFKGKSFEYWKELSIIVGNDFTEGRDIDDDFEDVRETIVGLDDDNGVEEIGDDEDFPETPVQSRRNGLLEGAEHNYTGPLKEEWNDHQSIRKINIAYAIEEEKKTMVDIVASIDVAVKEIGSAIVELRKLAANPHIQEVYRGS
ncbi:hypothetical protein AMTRI_Chr13g116100 [Amborella trichopoda]